MPTIEVNGVSLHYQEQGSGPEAVVFVHGLLMDHHMFDRLTSIPRSRH